ncbi:hypothetical protein ESP02_13730 [Enterococcus sp. NBRC 3427]|nr:hypothetical protein ESP02_13730 [Enterococcus sp. NBRC 3427]
MDLESFDNRIGKLERPFSSICLSPNKTTRTYSYNPSILGPTKKFNSTISPIDTFK